LRICLFLHRPYAILRAVAKITLFKLPLSLHPLKLPKNIGIHGLILSINLSAEDIEDVSQRFNSYGNNIPIMNNNYNNNNSNHSCTFLLRAMLGIQVDEAQHKIDSDICSSQIRVLNY
jgi:hypothetical protein